MQILINALVNGTNEFQDDGVVITKPPTAMSLRAARELTTLININATNHQLIMQLQSRVEEQLKEILNLQSNLNESNQRNQELRASSISSVCENTRETSEVGSTSKQPSGSDSDGEGRGTN